MKRKEFDHIHIVSEGKPSATGHWRLVTLAISFAVVVALAAFFLASGI